MKAGCRMGMICLLALALVGLSAQAQKLGANNGVLNRTQASKSMPATVFFRGQISSTQERNSCGIRLPNGRMMLAALVDTSGYASEVRANYQGYLLTEIPLNFEGHTILPGAYGFGFVADHQFVVLNLGGEKLWTAPTHSFHGHHAVPLEMLAAAGGYELCSGLECVSLHHP